MVVAGPEGFTKTGYRKYAIRGPIAPGDDFAMMREVMERRFGRALKEQAQRDEGGELGTPPDWPDMVLIDGGAGQFSAARKILDDLGVTDVKLVAIAKGPDRDAGREWFHTRPTRRRSSCRRANPVLYYLQRLRDEAHRFAITTHRAGRSKTLTTSELDEVDGIRSGAQAGAAEPFRLGARGEAGGAAGFGGGARHQPGDGEAGV